MGPAGPRALGPLPQGGGGCQGREATSQLGDRGWCQSSCFSLASPERRGWDWGPPIGSHWESRSQHQRPCASGPWPAICLQLPGKAPSPRGSKALPYGTAAGPQAAVGKEGPGEKLEASKWPLPDAPPWDPHPPSRPDRCHHNENLSDPDRQTSESPEGPVLLTEKHGGPPGPLSWPAAQASPGPCSAHCCHAPRRAADMGAG